jgi:hypothetical protein
MQTEPAMTVPTLPMSFTPSAVEPPTLPTAIRRALPSLCSLADEDVIHRPEAFLALADRVDAAMAELTVLDIRADAAEVVKFMVLVAERRGFALPSPTLLALDARAVASEMPADLLPLACGRLWARFAYRRLPEPTDFLAAVKDELAERREAAARIKTVALKIQHVHWLEEQRRKADARHAAARERDSQRRPDGPPAPPSAPLIDQQLPDRGHQDDRIDRHRQNPVEYRHIQEVANVSTEQLKVVTHDDHQVGLRGPQAMDQAVTIDDGAGPSAVLVPAYQQIDGIPGGEHDPESVTGVGILLHDQDIPGSPENPKILR